MNDKIKAGRVCVVIQISASIPQPEKRAGDLNLPPSLASTRAREGKEK
jgi:hypothetical protein